MTVSPVSGKRWSPASPETRSTVLEYSAATHVGMIRTVNEDAFMAGPPVFVVADGMGGYARGDVASALVVEAFQSLSGSIDVVPSDLDACLDQSRAKIRQLGDDDATPGSTVIVAAYVVQDNHGYWLIAHEGDSRAYMWRAGDLQQLTRDHSVVQELLDSGEINLEQARVHRERHVITRAVGALEDSRPEFSLVPVEPGARLLLCTDGLTGELSETSISRILGEAKGSGAAAEHLVRAAVDAGGHDNVTALVVDVLTIGDEMVVDTLGSSSESETDVPHSDTVRIPRRRS